MVIDGVLAVLVARLTATVVLVFIVEGGQPSPSATRSAQFGLSPEERVLGRVGGKPTGQ